MGAINLTTLRKQLYRVVDQVLETGVPVEIERNGKKLLIIPADQPVSKLANLKRRHGIIGNPDDLVEIKAGEWHELRNLS